MKIRDWYKDNWEHRLEGRYISLEMILPILDAYNDIFEISYIGISEEDRTIPLIRIGAGKKVILAWSQMHGNESTTTKALFDLFKFLNAPSIYQDKIASFLNEFSLVIIPMLNPDGSGYYTRENANKVDLNRDFQDLSQRESRYLRSVFEQVQPVMCLNMHDQRTIYGADFGKPATISFLAPAADIDRKITKSRKIAMEQIVRMAKGLENIIPGQIGRYDDSFNANCVGDSFQMEGVPTILFEAGHFPGDYEREKTREFVFYALLILFGIIDFEENDYSYKEYFSLPENNNNFRDLILRNAILPCQENAVDISIQYVETLSEGKIKFEPYIDSIGLLSELNGHTEINLNFSKILTDSQELLTVGVKVPKLFDKNEKSISLFN